MIVLDTNVISALMQTTVDPVVPAWLNSQPTTSVWTTAVCVFEIRSGLALLPAGRRKQALQDAFEVALTHDLQGRALDFDSAAASEAASIAAKLQAMGKPVEIRDVMIAGIVAAKKATLATRNTKHFVDAGIPLINPWAVSPP